MGDPDAKLRAMSRPLRQLSSRGRAAFIIAFCTVSLLSAAQETSTIQDLLDRARAEEQGGSHPARLRVTNWGSATIEALVVRLPGGDVIEFGDVEVGEITEYQSAERGVFSRPGFEFELDGQRVSQSVGNPWARNRELAGSSFTYKLQLVPGDAPKRLRLISVATDE